LRGALPIAPAYASNSSQYRFVLSFDTFSFSRGEP
jgi:hypothetical protein